MLPTVSPVPAVLQDARRNIKLDARTRAQIFPAQPLTPRGAPACSSLHLTLLSRLSHPGGRDRASQTDSSCTTQGPSRWPLGELMPGWGQGCYLLLHPCGQGAGGEVYVVSSHGILPTGRVPHLHGQVVLDACHQLRQRWGQVRGAGGQPLTWTSHLPPFAPISHYLP